MEDITKNRFVAVLDILGFKDMVLSTDHEILYHRIQELLDVTKMNDDLIQRMKCKEHKPTYFNFSDSFFVFSSDDSAESFDVFINFTQALFMNAIGLSFMIKGAIGFGKVSINENKRIFFGKPIIDAFLLQEDVKYLGIVFHHLAENQLRQIGSPDNSYKLGTLLSYISSGKMEHYNLLWFMEKGNKPYSLLTEDLENLRRTCSGYPRKYIDNTVEMIREYCEVINKEKNITHLT